MDNEVEGSRSRTAEGRSGTAEASRVISLGYDDFGWQMLEAAAKRSGTPIEDLIAEACGHLVVEYERGRPAARLPRVARPREGELRELTLTLPPRVWGALAEVADRQNLEMARLIEHATLLHISDLDTGRATRSILDDPGDES